MWALLSRSKEKEKYTATYTNHFQPKIVQSQLIGRGKIYKLTTLASIFTKMIRRYEDKHAEAFPYEHTVIVCAN